jgi:DNA-directed RNA polymerase subunit RPC12/RpoP
MAVDQDDPDSISAVCAAGHRKYAFRRDDGSWETAAQRMDRLERRHACIDCGKEHRDFRNDLWCEPPRRCPDCEAKAVIARLQRRGRQGCGTINNPASPWRRGANRIQKST